MQATTPSDNAGKPAWRRHFKARLADKPGTPHDAETLRGVLTELLGGRPPARIASFAALPGEPALLELVETLPKHQWFFPRIDLERLTFHRVRRVTDLVTGAFGIPEPHAGTEPFPIRHLDLVLCPGLGFGRDGSRLGRGGGFYDRVLAACRADTEIIGIAFDSQLVPRVPVEPHDIPLDRLVTPSGLIDIEPAR